MKTHYDTLGVKTNATQEEIKKAFRQLAHIHHPDKKTGNAERFKEINAAYQELQDPGKRANYDARMSIGYSQPIYRGPRHVYREYPDKVNVTWNPRPANDWQSQAAQASKVWQQARTNSTDAQQQSNREREAMAQKQRDLDDMHETIVSMNFRRKFEGMSATQKDVREAFIRKMGRDFFNQ